jgi:peptidoglycan lytic transglycosylase
MLLDRRLSLFAVLATVLATLLAGALTSSFSSDSSATKSTSSETPGKTLNGTATYYPNSLNGHKTSSGKRFHQNGHTAASNKLPPGTDVKVTNLKTGKTTDVKITDRGSKLGSHEIDLSKKAAREIGLTHKEGKVPVQIKVIGTPQGPSRAP